jgi:hypothetical protein
VIDELDDKASTWSILVRGEEVSGSDTKADETEDVDTGGGVKRLGTGSSMILKGCCEGGRRETAG